MPSNRQVPNAADLERVVSIFDTLMHRLMATHAPELSAIEMTMSQTKAMYLVVASGPMRMSELAARVGVTNSTATGQVDRLVELGLLARHEDPADRRQVVVSATPHGIEILERFRELNSRRMREMLARIEASDLPTVERALLILDAAVAAEASLPITATIEGKRS
jgi:DNA-binding MarR family transcriptional regulator